MAAEFQRIIPILRIFDVHKALEFYVEFLGCTIDWQHGEGEEVPRYLQVARGQLRLHLTEHHGDASPGARIYVEVTGLNELHAELAGKHYRYNHPAIETTPWGTCQLEVIDPFGNRLSFNERA